MPECRGFAKPRFFEGESVYTSVFPRPMDIHKNKHGWFLGVGATCEAAKWRKRPRPNTSFLGC